MRIDRCKTVFAALRGAGRDTAGAAMVEFTLVMPILILLSFGVFEIGRALQHFHAIEKGVRDATRYLARVDIACAPGNPVGNVVNGADLTTARNLAMTGYAAGAAPILAYWTDPASVAVDVRCIDNVAGTFRGQLALPVVRMTAQVSYQGVGFLQVIGLGPLAFTARHEELHIGE